MQIRENFPLKTVSTFAIGGPARYFILAKNEQDLIQALEFANLNNLKPFFYGGGSNLLFPDEGLNTLVVKIAANKIEHNPSTNTLYAQAGVTWGQIARFCSQNNLYGLEALYGLPGTIGGAVYGNGGCYGLETKDCLLEAKILDLSTRQTDTYPASKFNFAYRTSDLKKNSKIHPRHVLAATFKVSKNPKDASGDPSEIAQERKVKQPTGLTTGSFFKNPPNNFAGQLIEQAGLKGFEHNKIKISDMHANFFINTGGATAKDVIELMHIVQSSVKEKFGIELEPEVQIIESQDW